MATIERKKGRKRRKRKKQKGEGDIALLMKNYANASAFESAQRFPLH